MEGVYERDFGMVAWRGYMSVISVRVKPGAKVGPKLERLKDGSYVAYILARAHDGEANTALIELLSDYFHVAKTSIVIKTGVASRNKLVSIAE